MPYEMGWKDTVITYPGEVTRIVVRWAPQDAAGTPSIRGINDYPFDPTALIGGVGYVWHCHILDHEDNEMMRTYVVIGKATYPVAKGFIVPKRSLLCLSIRACRTSSISSFASRFL